MYSSYASGPSRLRDLQVEGVFRRFPNSRRVSYDNSTIDVPFNLPSHLQITLRVIMPPSFPQQPPIIKLQARADNHPNIDKVTSIILHPKLGNQGWPGPHANLGDILYGDIFPLFTKHPLKIIDYNPPNTPHTAINPNNVNLSRGPAPASSFNYQQYPSPSPPSMGASSISPANVKGPSPQSVPSPSPHPNSSASATTQIPKIPNQFPELEKLSDKELQDLIEDASKFQKFFGELEYVKNITKVELDMRDANLDISKKNISKHNELSKLSENLVSQQNQFNKLNEEYQQNLKKQHEIQNQYQPQHLLTLLDEKIKEAEEESEKLGEEFLSKQSIDDNDLKEFMQQFTQKRTLYFLRKSKREKLQQSC